MQENYREKRVLNNMMHDSNIKRSLGLEKKQDIVLGIMQKQGITSDPSKLAGYKKEAFLRAISKEHGLGYYDKKAFQSAYGEIKPKTNLVSERKKTYDEIMNKGKSNEQIKINNMPPDERRTIVQDFSVSNKHMHDAIFIHGTNKKINYDSNDNKHELNSDVESALKRIQS